MDYGFGERRNKGKDKFRERKKHPYKKGGRFRSINIDGSEKNGDGNEVNNSNKNNNKKR